MTNARRPPLAGIFVGGAAARMGGRPKGLLRAPEGVPIVERWRAMLRGLGADVVLVGQHEAYEPAGLEQIADDPPGIGPLGGLIALLRRAGPGQALALACDMPFVSRALVERLLATAGSAAIVAPRRNGRWEPLCARYDAARVLPLAVEQAASAQHSLQRLLDRAGAVEIALTLAESAELRDWDSPEDVDGRTLLAEVTMVGPHDVDISEPCGHVDQVRVRTVRRPAKGCEDCLKIGGQWVHLRECLTCGHIGCCDSSPNRHATAHFRGTHHPIVSSAEVGETWAYCYADDRFLSAD